MSGVYTHQLITESVIQWLEQTGVFKVDDWVKFVDRPPEEAANALLAHMVNTIGEGYRIHVENSHEITKNGERIPHGINLSEQSGSVRNLIGCLHSKEERHDREVYPESLTSAFQTELREIRACMSTEGNLILQIHLKESEEHTRIGEYPTSQKKHTLFNLILIPTAPA